MISLAKIKYFLIILLLIASFSLLSFSTIIAASGNYISEPIGEENAVGFKTFEVVEPNIPSGAGISYSFAGSQDNFSAWSNPVAISANYDLSNVEKIKNSKFIKVKITLDDGGNVNNSPSINGFKVTYEKEGSGSTTVTTNTSGKTGSTASNKSAVSKLVSTGASLWFNILIALIAAGIIAYFLLRPNKKSS